MRAGLTQHTGKADTTSSVPMWHAGLTLRTSRAAQAPGIPMCDMGLAHVQGKPTPTLGVRIPGLVAPPKLELIIFFLTIFSMSNAS